MTRLIQFAILLASIIPFGMAVRWGGDQLPERAKDVSFGIFLGILIAYALWRWHERIKERQGRGEYSFWD